MQDTLDRRLPPAQQERRNGPPTTFHDIAVFVSIAILYYLTGLLALQLLSESDGVAVFWPASGLAAGALVAMDRTARRPIALAVAVATIVANLEARSSAPATIVFAACNVAECLMFSTFMRWLDRSQAGLQSLWSLMAFLAAATLAAGIAAVPAAASIGLLGMSQTPFPNVWFSWFKSDALGILTVAPMLMTLPAVMRSPPGRLVLVEGTLVTLVTAVVAFFAFGLTYGNPAPVVRPPTLLFPLLLWLAARAPAVFSSFTSFLLAVGIVVVALVGNRWFGESSVALEERLAAAQIALVTTSFAILTLSAMFARVNNVAGALRTSDRQLRLALAAGRMYAFDHDVVTGTVVRTGGLTDTLGLPRLGSVDDYKGVLRPVDRLSYEALLEALTPNRSHVMWLFRVQGVDGTELSIEDWDPLESTCRHASLSIL